LVVVRAVCFAIVDTTSSDRNTLIVVIRLSVVDVDRHSTTRLDYTPRELTAEKHWCYCDTGVNCKFLRGVLAQSGS